MLIVIYLGGGGGMCPAGEMDYVMSPLNISVGGFIWGGPQKSDNSNGSDPAKIVLTYGNQRYSPLSL